MKTIKQLKDSIAILEKTDTSEMKKRDENKLRRELAFQRLCVKYLERNPSPEFLLAESVRLESSLSRIESSWAGVRSSYIKKNHGDEKKAVAEYNKDTNLSTIKKQLKAIKFLL